MRHSIIAAMLLTLAACQSPTVATAPASHDAAGKQFAPPPAGKGAVYFYNPAGTGPVLDVTIDGLEIGRLGVRTWLRTDVAAGHHVLRCRGAKTANARWVNIAAGDIRFVDVQLLPGRDACTLREVDAATGRAAVLRGTRALQSQ